MLSWLVTYWDRLRVRGYTSTDYWSMALHYCSEKITHAVRIGTGSGIMFSGCPSAPRSSVRSSGQTLPRYLMNGLSSLDETYKEYSLTLLTTWLDSGGQRSRSQQAVEVAEVSTSMIVEVRLLVFKCCIVTAMLLCYVLISVTRDIDFIILEVASFDDDE